MRPKINRKRIESMSITKTKICWKLWNINYLQWHDNVLGWKTVSNNRHPWNSTEWSKQCRAEFNADWIDVAMKHTKKIQRMRERPNEADVLQYSPYTRIDAVVCCIGLYEAMKRMRSRRFQFMHIQTASSNVRINDVIVFRAPDTHFKLLPRTFFSALSFSAISICSNSGDFFFFFQNWWMHFWC